ncbi:MAG: hypothetical protein A2653_00460 [Candidatus Zambryskibacteria bacterium RIFCSPHIGHO2_01_FULL_43_25]|uniref:Uncharacterized protein n=1 Tax=Candidatus Zambryskibacteria bacterium RIFCSPLOWO2_01_FULL_45_21 TaxID=1802761 RepID=A0A1G2U1F6_9BACT|nr:MAG: hypothetical protein A2653_00460 [Candidatus Zambryskibacteria bacterium RIFCSPHIGHO2_01_FULL_43_25]OHB00885.1 MAG: hypothetical protein A3E94_01365 [Candidatus Zambryskibacteria bacterium RIFCSPHIGHO2_12_FULL_44_12b]OHB03337.1 MAG: hypothetical protein A3B14_00295 [Candidatus Zambryskibacteria bacterium RIFCSPLOWO2_01_FULL_45_21]
MRITTEVIHLVELGPKRGHIRIECGDSPDHANRNGAVPIEEISLTHLCADGRRGHVRLSQLSNELARAACQRCFWRLDFAARPANLQELLEMFRESPP